MCCQHVVYIYAGKEWKTYFERGDVGVGMWKQLICFENKGIHFVTNKFLPESEEKGGNQ